ncbi:MAG: hypothetical protein KIH08_15500, partial [Candidatus Freyarchaeota archaeon]|nr:hypothetical protein [Candidatus Jordarchaeia archaeon]
FFDDNKIKFSTLQTVSLFEAISKKKVENVVSCAYGKSLDFHKMEIKIINSGHVFGSGALVIISKDVTFLYTGDFNFTDNIA